MTFELRHVLLAGFLGLLLGALAVHELHAASRPAQPVIADWQWQQVAPVTAGRTEAPHAADRPATVHPCETSGLWETAEDSQRDSQGYRPEGTCGASLILDPATPTQYVERPAVAPTAELHVVSKPTANLPTISRGLAVSGIASWGDGWSGVVTRLPRGTAICVAGPLGRWCGASVGYGPALWTGRIADLSRAVFGDICGPVSSGLCRVVLSW